MDVLCTSTQTFVGESYVFSCMREDGHFGSHQSIVAEYYKNKLLANALWNDSGAKCGAIDKMLWNECDECGILIDDLKSLCDSCKGWVDFLNRENSVQVIIDGYCYTIGPLGGFRGEDSSFEFFDSSLEPVTTDKLWHKGPVPNQFRDRLPDNAKWLSGGKPSQSHFANFSSLIHP